MNAGGIRDWQVLVGKCEKRKLRVNRLKGYVLFDEGSDCSIVILAYVYGSSHEVNKYTRDSS